MSWRYSDKESASILRRALEIQSGGPEGEAREGNSLDQLEAVGAELGVRAEAIRQASEEFEQKARLRTGLWGPRILTADAQVTTRLGAGDWAGIIETIRHRVGETGTVSEVGSSIEWTAGTDDHLRVSLVPNERGTFIRATMNPRDQSSLTVFFSMLGGLMVGAVMSKIGLPVAVYALLAVLQFAAFMIVGQAIFRGVWIKKKALLDQLVNAVVAAVPSEAPGMQSNLEAESANETRLNVGPQAE